MSFHPSCLRRRALAALLGAVALTALHDGAAAAAAVQTQAQFGDVRPSAGVRRLADWVVASRDNAGMSFVLLDKARARLYVFRPDGRLRGTTPVLLGFARGDHSVPGIGTRPLRAVRPHERTTPAGRFVAERGTNLSGEDVVWVDYDAAVSMHRVRATNPAERRLQRLASRTHRDNRISYGCINLPAAFYDATLKPAFATGRGMVYVLPEVRPMSELFVGLPALRTAAAAGGRGAPTNTRLRASAGAR